MKDQLGRNVAKKLHMRLCLIGVLRTRKLLEAADSLNILDRYSLN